MTSKMETGQAGQEARTGAIYDALGQQGIVLALDTATSAMSVALLNEGKLLAESQSLVERNHSVYLTPAIDEVLDGSGLRPRNIQGIAVGKGPGSYTGVRIGITVAKTMAWSLKIPVVAVSSLEAMAAGALKAWISKSEENSETYESDKNSIIPHGVWVIPLLNARRGQAFTALFSLKSAASLTRSGVFPLLWPVSVQGWERPYEDGIRLVEGWVDELLEKLRLATEPPSAVLFVGEIKEFSAAIERFTQEAAGGSTKVRTEAFAHDIQAEFIGYLGMMRLAQGEQDDVHSLLPNYTQLPEAEVQLAARSGKSE